MAVERLVDRGLRERPVILAPERAARAVVYDMSDEAYQSGVRKGMPLRRARRYCKDAVVLPPLYDRYERATRQLLKHAFLYSPLIEVTDHKGHLFIDVTGTKRLFGCPPDVAWRIRNSMRADMGFDPVWSVAPNKLVAKVATRMVKPAGEYIVGAGEEENFIKPFPLSLVPGVEKEDVDLFHRFNMTRAGQVARLSVDQLYAVFGKRSRHIYDAVRGIDPSPVYPVGNKPPVASAGHRFGNDSNDREIVESVLFQLTERVGADLRKRHLAARRIRMVLDYSDGCRIVRQAVVSPAGANDFCLFPVAKKALERAWTRRVRIRHMRLIGDRLTGCPAQMELFPEDEENRRKKDNLISAIDRIRRRFGDTSIRPGKCLVVNPAP